MITFFCPLCWKEIKGDDRICPCCGANISDYESKGFEEKLTNALGHREREPAQRAVCILGSRKSTKAVKPLLKLFKQANSTLLKTGIMAQEITNKEFINHNE